MALPFYAAQMLLARWISGQARGAVLPELYRWIFLVPLVGAVLSTIAKRPKAFRVTPKAPGQQRRVELGLALPLLGPAGGATAGADRPAALAAAGGADGADAVLAEQQQPAAGAVVALLLGPAGRQRRALVCRAQQQSWGHITALSEAGLEARLTGTQSQRSIGACLLSWPAKRAAALACAGAHSAASNSSGCSSGSMAMPAAGRCAAPRLSSKHLGPVLLRLIKPAAAETWFNRSLLPLELQGLASSPLTQASRPSPMKESANTRMNIASPG